ncbi:hypothetical protein SSX86_022894 [Deinandra increscens subsp. villosa]|uniref:Calmodulin-binding domain-containing protein n=1 Tax=Deinandra increscens subsp. villosa TaxID=3103831 RepID=A0AAP0CJQ5_9ASTR
MVQKKVPNIKPQLVINLRPSSPSSTQTHEKMKKIMKKPRPIKRSDESRSSAPLHDNKPVSTPLKQTPNYMKSTSSFEARKEHRSPKTPTPKSSRTSSLKMVRSLTTKTPSFKPLRSSKKVILDAQRATCSSTLKESKFPSYLELDHESDGLSTIKVCPYTYCSLNGHHHAPVPPLKYFLAARRRALKEHEAKKPGVILGPEGNRELLVDNYNKNGGGKRDEEECCDVDWEEGYCSDSDGLKLQEFDHSRLQDEHQELYDEESVSSGAWSLEEDGDSASSDGLCEQINQDYLNYDSSEVSSAATAGSDDQVHGAKVKIDYQKEETSEETNDKNRSTIIYNIIHFINISVFVNGEKTNTDRTVPATCVDANRKEREEAGEVNQTVAADEQVSFINVNHDHEYDDDDDAYTQSNLKDEEVETVSADEDQTHGTNEIKSESNDQLPDACINLRDLTGSGDDDDAREFNPRGPNFLSETPEPDAETVDLRHQMIDERKNAEEWMVDFALQQAVTTLAPARKRKVALLVEAFEKVMPDPIRVYETHNTSKAFTNSRPMQACSS